MKEDGSDEGGGLAGSSVPAPSLSHLSELNLLRHHQPPGLLGGQAGLLGGQAGLAAGHPGGMMSPAGLQAALVAGLAAQQQLHYQRALLGAAPLLGLHQHEALLAAWSKMAVGAAASLQHGPQQPEPSPPPPPPRRPTKLDMLNRPPEPAVSVATPTALPADGSPAGSDGSPPAPRPPDKKPTVREKVFTCQVCSRSFGYKHVLQNHERTHTGEKPFECKECHKRFTRDHHLKTHMRLHTGEKPYHCVHCDRQFVQVANLRRHLRVHTGERPYACELCQAKFSDSNQLKAHMLIHNGEKPFQCVDCLGSYRRRHHLVHHKCPMRPASTASRSPPDEPAPSNGNRSPGESSETRSDASSVEQKNEQLSISNDGHMEPVRKHVRKASETRRVVRPSEEPASPTLRPTFEPMEFCSSLADTPEQTEPEDLSMTVRRPSQAHDEEQDSTGRQSFREDFGVSSTRPSHARLEHLRFPVHQPLDDEISSTGRYASLQHCKGMDVSARRPSPDKFSGAFRLPSQTVRLHQEIRHFEQDLKERDISLAFRRSNSEYQGVATIRDDRNHGEMLGTSTRRPSFGYEEDRDNRKAKEDEDDGDPVKRASPSLTDLRYRENVWVRQFPTSTERHFWDDSEDKGVLDMSGRPVSPMRVERHHYWGDNDANKGRNGQHIESHANLKEEEQKETPVEQQLHEAQDNMGDQKNGGGRVVRGHLHKLLDGSPNSPDDPMDYQHGENRKAIVEDASEDMEEDSKGYNEEDRKERDR